MKRNSRFPLLLVALLVVLTSAPAASLLAQAARVQVNDAGDEANGQARAAADEEGDEEDFGEFRPEFNTSVAAENLLRVARTLAEAGAYAEASQRYLELAWAHPNAVSGRGKYLYLPIWRTVVEDVLAWPAEGLQEFREAINPVAREQWRAALRSGSLREIERVAQQQFLSDVGDNAMVALGDRLRESGYPALALYYYKLVLDKHPSCDIPGDELILRATLAASELPGGGSVVNLASMASYMAVPLVPGYGAAKAGVVQMTKTLAAEWAVDGIRVNAVAPGLIDTPMTTPLKGIDALEQPMLDRTPLGRWGTPEDVAPVVLFLASAAAGFVTGQTLPVCGGYSVL